MFSFLIFLGHRVMRSICEGKLLASTVLLLLGGILSFPPQSRVLRSVCLTKQRSMFLYAECLQVNLNYRYRNNCELQRWDWWLICESSTDSPLGNVEAFCTCHIRWVRRKAGEEVKEKRETRRHQKGMVGRTGWLEMGDEGKEEIKMGS